MNRNKKGLAAPKAALNSQLLQKLGALELALQKAKRLRGASEGGFDLSNSSRSSGRLALSSSNSSRVRKTHLLEEDEYIADIAGSVGFATTAYPINPGQSSTFPWGNKIAALYEKYEFQMLEFYYRREVSEFATNGQAGKIMLSCDYDASDSAPTTKQQVLDTEPHVDGMPCTETITLRVDPRQMRRQDGCYVRPGVQPPNTDIKTYDAGNLFVSTFGNTNATVIGELRVRYKCLVSVPVLESAIGGSGAVGSFFQVTSSLSGEPVAASATYQVDFAAATSPIVIANGIGATLASSGLITLPVGSYLIENMSNTSTPSAANITIGQSQLASTATPGSTFIKAVTGALSASADVSGFTGWLSGSPPMVWNTSYWGTSLCLQSSCTFASGTAVNQAHLKITLL
jgi:hypothetical protein